MCDLSQEREKAKDKNKFAVKSQYCCFRSKREWVPQLQTREITPGFIFSIAKSKILISISKMLALSADTNTQCLHDTKICLKITYRFYI